MMDKGYLAHLMQGPSPCDKCPFRATETSPFDQNCADHPIACRQFERYVEGQRWAGFPRWPLHTIYRRVFTTEDET